MASNLVIGGIYYDGGTERGVIAAIINSVEIGIQRFPVFVIVEHTRKGGDGFWRSEGHGIYCDDDKGSGIGEDNLLDTFEREAGETWNEAILREIADGGLPVRSNEARYELAAEAFAMGGMTGYNEAMGYGTVSEPEEESWYDEY
jgi:hypothetical protein